MRCISLYHMFILCCLTLFTLTSCGGDSSTTPSAPTPPAPPAPPPPPVPTRIEITPATARLNAIGQTVQLAARVLDQNGSAVSGAAVTWKSGAVDVALVTDQGLVTAVDNGTAVITAQSGSLSTTVNVTVSQTPGRIVIEPKMATFMAIGETVQLTAAVQDRNQNPVLDAEVIWQSSDADVASVSDMGLVTAVGNGTARITARSGSASAAIDVSVMAPSPDRTVLALVYEATNGSEWTHTTNWLSDAPLNEWHGVTTDARDRVVTLDLSNNNLSGSIPMEVELLTYLEGLKLGSNRISGEIPASVGQLANLRELDLSNNRLTGGIPVSFGQLSNLRVLSLTWNDLSGGIPVEIGQLSRLENLKLYRNRLSGEIPAELGGLVNISSFGIGNNQLAGVIPATIGQLENLVVLGLENNNLGGVIPAELGRLPHLKILDLSGNGLTGVPPPELGRLSSLQTLQLSNNTQMIGPLPESFTNLDLHNLYLGGTNLCIPDSPEFQAWIAGIDNVTAATCIVPDREALSALYNETDGPNWSASAGWLEIGPLNEWHGVTTDGDGRVTELNLENNSLDGSLPYVLGDLSELKKLYLGGNRGLSGPLPRSFTNLDLEVLRVEGSQLCASDDAGFQAWLQRIPDRNVATCGSTSLDRAALVAFYHALDGPNWDNDANWLSELPLDEWLGVTATSEERVTALNLSYNNLNGSLPREIGQLTGLTVLNLSLNNVTGSIPSDLGLLTELTELDLFRNALSGAIPSQLGRLARLERLILAANRLSGIIPSELGQLGNLSLLNVYNNLLTGPVPAELGQLTTLEELVLGKNDLSGPIPNKLGNLTGLTMLDLSDNRLAGNIPVELGNLQSMKWLTMSRNLLEGEIPAELGRLTALSGLSANHNRLTGEIPVSLWDLTQFKWLRLNDNLLNGALPPELGQLTGIEILDLSNNVLEGAIPPEVGQLVHLVNLFLNGNRMSGNIPPELADLSRLRTLNVADNSGLSGPLPLELTRLNLDNLLAEGTKLCAPNDSAFQQWLSGIVVSRVPSCDLSTGSAAYLTQATQSFTNPVPLIAGEEALLRVFVISDTGADADTPPVRATFYHGGMEVHSVGIAGNGSTVSREVDEGSLSASVNAEVPGWVVTPGLEMVVEIDPDGTADASMGVRGRLPAAGRSMVDVRSVPPLDLTLVPFLWSEDPDRSILSELSELSDNHELFRPLNDLLPVRELNLTVRDPVLTSVNPTFDNRDQLLRETRLVYEMDDSDGYYMGIIVDEGGLAELGGATSVSSVNGFVIAHELGHNMGLMHAPCGSPDLVDQIFPYSEGTIGAWGYDRRDNRLVDSGTYDLMSYCHPQWISDYNFTRALRDRLYSTAASVATSGHSGRNLAVWGGVNEAGELVLEPAFVVDAASSLPIESGPYRIHGEDADGNTLFVLRFHMRELADGEGGVFAYMIPARPDWSGRLSRIVLSGPEGHVEMTRDDRRPAALLIDSAYGSVRGILRDWPADPGEPTGLSAARRALPEQGLDVITSPGIPDPADWE